ncbi:outer membrane beta-barrel protein [bacterium]|nr:outer membrane beta-barrel protein [bacterium]
MNTKGKGICLLLACIVSFSSVYGQNRQRRFFIGGFGGMGVPVGPSLFQDYYHLSSGGGLDFTTNFSNRTALHFGFTYQPFHFDDEQSKEEINDAFGEWGTVDEIKGGSMWLSMFSVDVLQYFQFSNRPFRFFVMVGGDVTIRKTANVEIKGSVLSYHYDRTDTLNSETAFGLNGGAGFMWMFSDRMHLFVLGQYHHVFSEGIDLWNPKIFSVENGGKALSFISLITGLRFGL